MNPVTRALWFIESHFTEDIGLDDVARVACVSRFHLSRAFDAATGCALSRYVRSRRLSEAAKVLAAGAPDILALALASGYGSHEAFTRAFRDHFGVTPEAVRSRGHTGNLNLMEPFSMDKIPAIQLAPPRVETGRALLAAGLAARYNSETRAAIPALWQRFVRHIGKVPGQAGFVAYGVCYNGDDAGNFDYLCGVEVSDFSRLPAEFARVRIAEHHYAVFTHSGHVSGLPATFNAIWNNWLPQSGHEIADAPLFERYAEDFNGMTGMGGVEVWVPVKEKG